MTKEELTKLLIESYDRGVEDAKQEALAALEKTVAVMVAAQQAQQECQCNQGQVCRVCDPIPPAQQKPVATLWQHSRTGRTRITMPGDITDCDADWFKASDLYTSPPAQQKQKPVAFPARSAVEREIERTANPTGMHLNDGKERVALPGGTLRHLLALIDRTSPPAQQEFMKQVTIVDAPSCLNTHDKAMWVLGWNECVEAAPPQRTWIGLTDEEIEQLWYEFHDREFGWAKQFARAIEAAVRSKNNGST